jgi:N-acetylmuramoyl-L-alanine amidase
MLAKYVTNIACHCTGGFGDVDSILRYWFDVLKWKQVGYHRLIDLDGDIHDLADFNEVVNGVYGWNKKTLHVAYIGGVDPDNPKISLDTRTMEQKRSIKIVLAEMLEYLHDNGKDITKNLGVVGHRDFSTDLNKNGLIDPFERMKDCPSFDAILEYCKYASFDRQGKLPTSL